MAEECDSTDILILAAHPLELVGVKSRLGGKASGVCGELSVRCAAVGVGAVAAGIGSSRALNVGPAKAAVLLGSFGCFPDEARSPRAANREIGLGELASVSAFELVDSAVAAGEAAFPEPMESVLSVDEALCAGLAALHEVGRSLRLATTAGITTGDELAASLARVSGCQGENLEGFAVAMACRDHGVRLGALMAVTNVVGSKGRGQWLRHHHAAAEASAAALWAWLLAGVSGL